MSRRSLPIVIQTFRKIREGNYYHVDKTGFALRLIDQGKYYFLPRPQRFGKSLFLDTTATTGWARRSTTPLTCCYCLMLASSAPGGSRPAHLWPPWGFEMETW